MKTKNTTLSELFQNIIVERDAESEPKIPRCLNCSKI